LPFSRKPGAARFLFATEEHKTVRREAIIAVVGIVSIALAWSLQSSPPAGVPKVPTISVGGSVVFAATTPAGNASGIENIYIMEHGNYAKDENLSGHENILGVITSSGGSVSIPYETLFDIVVAVKAGSDNMAYVVKENMKVELAASGSFTITQENSADANEYVFENSGYGTTDGWLRANVVWDNAGNGYSLPADGSITLDPVNLWCWG